MPRLSFRFKLLLAMMLVVGGVSGMTLYLTQERVQAAYEKLFKEKLDAQITYVPREQDLRIGKIKKECERLAKSVRIRAKLGADAADLPEVYQDAQAELNIILREEGEPGGLEGAPVLPPTEPPKPVPPPEPDASKSKAPVQKLIDAGRKKLTGKLGAAPPVVRQPYLGFLDTEGNVIEPPGNARTRTPDRAKFFERLAKLGPVIKTLETQQVGYLELGGGRLTEVIVTPVLDEGRILGAMVYGIQFFDAASAATEEVISGVLDIQSGTWMEGRLHTSTIPASVRPELEKRLPEEIRHFPQPRDTFIVNITQEKKEVPHRVFYSPLNEGSLLPIAYRIGLYSWGDAIKAQADLRTQILSFSAIAVVVALLVSLALAHGLSIPIRELVGATEQISEGNFTVQLPVRSQDDLGQLAKSFNEMAADLALKDKYHSILHTIADKDVAQQLLEGKIALGGELREATVMFCDIRGFTALTQNMNPTEVIAMLNEHMTVLTRVVTEHHGVVDKFIGDSIMALFGAPKSYGDDALNAVRCAQQMMAERAKLNATSVYKIQMGIGLASGRVLAGNMGSADRSNYTVLGERVNLAARQCSFARRG